MNPPTCISYIRFSSERQALGSSLDRQLKKSRAYAEKHGYVIDDRFDYRDLGVSAYTGDNAKFGDLSRFIEAIQRGDIPRGSILLVESLDRLSRESVFEALALLQKILAEGIKVVTLADEIEYTKENLETDFSKLIISLSIMMRANEEVKLRSQRIRDGFEKKRRNLANIKMTANVPTWLKLIKETNSFEIDEDKSNIVKKIFQMSYDGNGVITIARHLNKLKVPAFRSKIGWSQSTVRKILSSRSVIGEYQPHIYRKGMKIPEPVGDVVCNYFPTIVDKDIYDAVQARLSNGTHIAGRTGKVENLFGGLTYCGYCGARMDVCVKGKVRYLVCTNARKGIKCSYVSYICNELETAFFTFCRDKELLDVINIEGVADKEKKKGLMLTLSAKQGELLSVERSIAILDEELIETEDKLLRQHIKQNLSVYLEKKSILEMDITNIQRDINNIDLSIGDLENKAENMLENIKQIENSENVEQRIYFRKKLQNSLRQIVKRVEVFPRGSVFTDDQISKVRTEYEMVISKANTIDVDALNIEIDQHLEYMLSTQSNTKNKRFFKVYFKNGNYRKFNFDISSGKHHISRDLQGSTLSIWFNKFKMSTQIIVDEEDNYLKYARYLREKHPDMSDTMIEESINTLRQMALIEE